MQLAQKRAVESLASFLELAGMPKEVARKMAADEVARMGAEIMVALSRRFAA